MANIDYEIKKFDELITKLYDHDDKDVVNLTSLIDDVVDDIKTEYADLQDKIEKLEESIEKYDEAMHAIKIITNEDFD